MTDRELLEKAAEVAGIEVTAVVAEGIPHRFGGGYWNPLRNDGDALRLAVKLQMTIWTYGDKATAAGSVIPPTNEVVCEPCGDGDWNAATRRAIVRAAAAMAEKPTLQN